MKMVLNKKQNNEKGFAMLFAVLTASLLVTIGVSIFSISLKELMISASIRDSQTAYYAARSANECFKYWEYYDTSGVFNPIDSSNQLKSDGSQANIVCNGITVPIILLKNNNTYTYNGLPFFKYSSVDDTGPEASFSYQITAEPQYCDPSIQICSATTYSMYSTTTFRGYNTGSSGRRVERGYTIAY